MGAAPRRLSFFNQHVRLRWYGTPRDDVAHDYPTGWVRAPADNSLSFVHEGFWDELAVAARQVEKVWVVADVGPIILNPTTAEAQVEA